VILFKVSLSLGIELANSMTRLGANFVSPAMSIGATWLPTELQRNDCNSQRDETFTGAEAVGPGVAPLMLPTV
jgi:hypothetical protein